MTASEAVEVTMLRCLATAMPTGLESSIEDTESGEVMVSLFSLRLRPDESPLRLEAGLVKRDSLGLLKPALPGRFCCQTWRPLGADRGPPEAAASNGEVAVMIEIG